MHDYIKTNINKEIWVVIKILVQKSVRCILSGVVACDIFLIGGQPYVTVCYRGRRELYLVQKSVTYFLNGPYELSCRQRANPVSRTIIIQSETYLRLRK